MLQHASSPEPDVVITLRRCYVNYTGFLFGGEWSSNSPVWYARHDCAVKCLSTWLMIGLSISSPRATDDPFGLPMIACAQCLVRTTALETSFGLWRCWPANLEQFTTYVACEYLTLVTNIFKHYVWLAMTFPITTVFSVWILLHSCDCQLISDEYD